MHVDKGENFIENTINCYEGWMVMAISMFFLPPLGKELRIKIQKNVKVKSQNIYDFYSLKISSLKVCKVDLNHPAS